MGEAVAGARRMATHPGRLDEAVRPSTSRPANIAPPPQPALTTTVARRTATTVGRSATTTTVRTTSTALRTTTTSARPTTTVP
jgi:hypothetical protein